MQKKSFFSEKNLAFQPSGLVNVGNFPPSVQANLFEMLTPEQQKYVRPILRVIKKPAQIVLCKALIEHIETGADTTPQDITLGAIFLYITRPGGVMDF